MTTTGRFAPSPTSSLHLGNLRTALAAVLAARAEGGRCLLRIEDLDRDRVAAAGAVEPAQRADLAALGLVFDGPVVRQSERPARYADAVAALGDRVYECFCTRREIAEAASAPHDGFRAYPGTCRDLSSAQRAERRLVRTPALRVRADVGTWTVHDAIAGEVTGAVDDLVLRRADGAFAYNLAVVVDDLAQGVTQVVRGDDLLSSAPRQAWLATRLGGALGGWCHLPLAVDETGRRLAKRDGATGVADWRAAGVTPDAVRGLLAASLGLADDAEQARTWRTDPPGVAELVGRWSPARVPRAPWVAPMPPPTS